MSDVMVEDEPLNNPPKMLKEYLEKDYQKEFNDFFTKYMWPITCSILVLYNTIVAVWFVCSLLFTSAEYAWERHYFVMAGLIISVFVVSYSHKHFIRNE